MAATSRRSRWTPCAWSSSTWRARPGRISCPGGAFYGWPYWSPDSTSITLVTATAIERVTIADRHVETIVGRSDSDLAQGQLGAWLGATPDGWPVTTLDAGTHDIYALDWEAP